MKDLIYMRRCLELAVRGLGFVSPNPVVGAVLVHEDKVIGEGYHEFFGGPHAEVNCIRSVAPDNQRLIASSTLYVSLEPCNHQGKTPPCTDFIIKNQIPKVVVACTDPNARVCGTGISRLRNAGVEVITGVLQEEAELLNKPFFNYHQLKRPYVILKWAQTADGYLSGDTGHRLKISGPITDRIVHRWRTECDAIMVGTRTLLSDNPQLTVRWYPGNHPVRVAIDKQLKAPMSHAIFDGEAPTLVFNKLRSSEDGKISWIQLTEEGSWIPAILRELHMRGIQTLMVEGGSDLLRHFIETNCWDEARIITNTQLWAHAGTFAPSLTNAKMKLSQNVRNDRIDYYLPIKI